MVSTLCLRLGVCTDVITSPSGRRTKRGAEGRRKKRRPNESLNGMGNVETTEKTENTVERWTAVLVIGSVEV